MRAITTVALLLASNIFMTFAWYGHLRFGELEWVKKLGFFGVILISWGIAFFEYTLMVPANRIGFEGTGGPFSLLQLKVIQEVVTLVVFVAFSILFFRNEPPRWNQLVGFGFLVLAVYFIFKK